MIIQRVSRSRMSGLRCGFESARGKTNAEPWGPDAKRNLNGILAQLEAAGHSQGLLATTALRVKLAGMDVLKDEVQRELVRLKDGKSPSRQLHPAVLSTNEAIQANASVRRDGVIYPNRDIPHVSCVVTRTIQRRAFKVLDCILRCAEQIGVELVIDRNVFQMKLGDQSVSFGLREPIKFTAIADQDRRPYDAKFQQSPSGKLEFYFDEVPYEVDRVSWKDRKVKRLEDYVEAIIHRIPSVVQAHREHRLKWEEIRRQQAEESRKSAERRRRHAEEEARRELLMLQAQQWHSSKVTAAFVQAAREAMCGRETIEFKKWASWVDHIVAESDPLLGDEKPWYNRR